jgi:hypothetical protein
MKLIIMQFIPVTFSLFGPDIHLMIHSFRINFDS